MAWRFTGRATVDPDNPRAFACCDRCGFWYNHKDLKWQFRWQGPQLQNIRVLVCDTCLDVPNENIRTIILPPDPLPILNARPDLNLLIDAQGPVPVNVTPPVIGGYPYAGGTLLVIPGAWSSTVPLTITHQWMNGFEPIEGETGEYLSLTTEMVGMSINCVETAFDGSNSVSYTTGSFTILAAIVGPTFTLQPVGGLFDPVTGDITLTVSATGTGSVTYQWQSWNGDSWLDLPGETTTSYTADTDAGVYRCMATDTLGSIPSYAANVAPYPSFFDGWQTSAMEGFDGDGMTAAFSSARSLFTTYTGARYTLVTGAVSEFISQIEVPTDPPEPGRNFIQNTSGLRPTIATVNTRDVIRFDGVDDRMTTNTWYLSYMDRDAAYFIASGVVRSLSGDDEPTEPWNNDVFVMDEGGNFGIALRQSPGSGNSTIQSLFYGDAQEIIETVGPTTDLVGAPIVFEWLLQDAVLYARYNGGTWVETPAPGLEDGPFNSINLSVPNFVGIATAIDVETVAFFNLIPQRDQMDAAATGLLDYLDGNASEPWLATLPSYGVPWNTVTPLDTVFLVDGVGTEIQRDATAAPRFWLSAENPDYDVAMHVEVFPEDIWATTNRMECEAAGEYGAPTSNIYGAFTFMIDNSVGNDRFLFTQYHAASPTDPDATDGTSATLAFRYGWNTAGNLSINTETSTTNPAYDGQHNTYWYDAPITKGEPHDIVYVWRPDGTGTYSLFKVWLDGVLIIDTDGPSGLTAAEYYYPKWGAYNGAGGVDNPVTVWFSGVQFGNDPGVLSRIYAPWRNPF